MVKSQRAFNLTELDKASVAAAEEAAALSVESPVDSSFQFEPQLWSTLRSDQDTSQQQQQQQDEQKNQKRQQTGLSLLVF